MNVGAEELKPAPNWVWVCLTQSRLTSRQGGNSGATFVPSSAPYLGGIYKYHNHNLGSVKALFWFWEGFNIWQKSNLKEVK